MAQSSIATHFGLTLLESLMIERRSGLQRESRDGALADDALVGRNDEYTRSTSTTVIIVTLGHIATTWATC
jgi:hypothetical protein